MSVVILTVAIGQTSSANSWSAMMTPLEALRQSQPSGFVTETSDSLQAKRSFFSTAILQQGNRLDRRLIRPLMANYPQAFTLYRQGQWLKPVGPLLVATGLVVSYIAVKGTSKTAYARGIGTPSNPSPPDVLVAYTSRSLPTLLGGIGLVVGGLCLVEIANGQLTKSVTIYNAKTSSHKSVRRVQEVRFGLTSGGNLGFILAP